MKGINMVQVKEPPGLGSAIILHTDTHTSAPTTATYMHEMGGYTHTLEYTAIVRTTQRAPRKHGPIISAEAE